MKFAGLDANLATATNANSNLNASWLFVRNWTEESRYSAWTKNDAEAMIRAIIGKTDGVLPWIKRHW